jgi:hypothetical protein
MYPPPQRRVIRTYANEPDDEMFVLRNFVENVFIYFINLDWNLYVVRRIQQDTELFVVDIPMKLHLREAHELLYDELLKQLYPKVIIQTHY